MKTADLRGSRRIGLPSDTDPAPIGSAPSRPPRKSRLWLWVLLAFLVQIAAWTAWFIIASHHRVAEVPLTTGSAHP